MCSEPLESKAIDAKLHRPATLSHGQASRESRLDGTSNARSTDDGNSSGNENTIAKLRERFDLADEILKELDEGTKKKRGECGYSLRFYQERRHLEHVYALCTSRRNMAGDVLREILQRLNDLRRKLSEFPSLFYPTNFRSSPDHPS